MDNNQENSTPNLSEVITQRSETTHPFNKENLNRISGRMGRLDFAILSIGLFLLVVLIQKALGINPFIIGASVYTEEELITDALLNKGILISTLGLFVYAFLSIKRLHDINYSGWLALIFVAPLLPLGLLSGLLAFASLIIRLILWFAKGEPKANRFGPIPDGNHRNKLLLLAGTIIMIVLVYFNLYSEAKPIIEPIFEQMLIEMQNQ